MKEVYWPESTGHDAIDALRAIEVAARRCSPKQANLVVTRGIAIAHGSGKLEGLKDPLRLDCGELLVEARRGVLISAGGASVVGYLRDVQALEDDGGLPLIACHLDAGAVVSFRGRPAEPSEGCVRERIKSTSAFYVPVGQILSATGN